MSVIVKGGGKPEEEKTVTAGTSVMEVLPSSGKVMKKVTINPTPSQSKSVTPTAAGTTVYPDSGKLLSSVPVVGDSNLVAENIKSGVSIFGITGKLNSLTVKRGTYNTQTTRMVRITHGLGKTPKIYGISSLDCNASAGVIVTANSTNIEIEIYQYGSTYPQIMGVSWFVAG